MKTEGGVLFLALLTAVVAQLPIQNERIRGEWVGPYVFPTILALGDNGIDSLCRSSLPPACQAEIPGGEERVVITATTISISYTTLVGVRTRERAAELFPACAAAGIYPFETITPLPPAPIEAYVPSIGSVTFTDPRRTNDPNCAFVTREDNGNEKRIRVRYLLSSTDASVANNAEVGPRLGCSASNGQCVSEVGDDGVLRAIVNINFVVSCVGGACLN